MNSCKVVIRFSQDGKYRNKCSGTIYRELIWSFFMIRKKSCWWIDNYFHFVIQQLPTDKFIIISLHSRYHSTSLINSANIDEMICFSVIWCISSLSVNLLITDEMQQRLSNYKILFCFLRTFSMGDENTLKNQIPQPIEMFSQT